MREKEIKESIPLGCLEELEFKPCPCKEFLNPEGSCYEVNSDIGEGYYWYYDQPGMFVVALMDIKIKEDYIMEYQQPDFISVNYYDMISAEELLPYKRMKANCIRGHVSNGELFRARYHKNIPIKGTELILMPGFYHDYLEKRYPGEYPNPKNAFMSVDGLTDFPELVLILKQIGKFQGTGIAADLYYESKVSEALSLIIERTRKHSGNLSGKELSKQDRINLDAVKSYIEDHFAFDIKTEQLAMIACMGQTKLRSSFKQAYGHTITEYIQSRRLAHAEFLLLKTDFNISQVAEAVGYHHAGRFSSLFKKNMGMFPDEYRKMIK